MKTDNTTNRTTLKQDNTDREDSIDRQEPFDQKEKEKGKNSAMKAADQAQSAIGNTNPNVRTGLSDDMNDTGTNVAYTEKES